MKFTAYLFLVILAVASVAGAQTNLYNSATTSLGFIQSSTGILLQPGDPAYCHPSTPIAVAPGSTYFTSQELLGGNAGIAYYNGSNYVDGSSSGVSAGGTFVVPAGVTQIEFSVYCSISAAEVFTLQKAAGAGGGVDVGTTSTDAKQYNVIFGANNASPTGDHNSVFGVNAGMSLTTGREMTIFGAQACQAYTGVANGGVVAEDGLSTCIGSYAGLAMLANSAPFNSIDNTFVGQKAGASITAADSEVMVGAHGGIDIKTGAYDTVIGAHTMDGPATLNSRGVTVVGGASLNGIGDKDHIVAVGSATAPVLQQASQDVFVGTNAYNLLHAYRSVIIGDNAGNSGTTVDSSIIVGFNAGPNTPSNSIIVGPFAGLYATGAEGTYVGNQAGNQITTGADNVCLGPFSCGFVHTGANNVAVGNLAGNSLSGNENFTVALGTGATTAGGVDNAAQIGFGQNATPNSLQFRNTQVVDANGDLHTGTVAPASSDPCSPGAVRVVQPYVYACVSPNTWMRAALNAY